MQCLANTHENSKKGLGDSRYASPPSVSLATLVRPSKFPQTNRAKIQFAGPLLKWIKHRFPKPAIPVQVRAVPPLREVRPWEFFGKINVIHAKVDSLETAQARYSQCTSNLQCQFSRCKTRRKSWNEVWRKTRFPGSVINPFRRLRGTQSGPKFPSAAPASIREKCVHGDPSKGYRATLARRPKLLDNFHFRWSTNQ